MKVGSSLLSSKYTKINCSDLSDPILVSMGLFGDDSVECGQVTVPSNWSAKNSNTIKLAVYRIPSTSPSPAPDPVVYLSGGPGGSGVSHISKFSVGPAAYLRARSDVIVIDQRGTGYSEPALFCPEVFKAPEEISESLELSHYQTCHDRLAKQGVRFADYNSAYNAKDVNAVREALGYSEWNLYGVSYGTRLALTAMRDLPAGIRSVVLDSVFPVDVNAMAPDTPYSYYWAIEQIATNCSADRDCATNMGDIKGLIEKGIKKLSSYPAGYLDVYKTALKEGISHPQLASTIAKVATGSETEVKALIQQVGQLIQSQEKMYQRFIPSKAPPALYPFLSVSATGMFWTVLCGEEAPYLDRSVTPNISANFQKSTQQIINQAGQKDLLYCNIFTVPARGEIETQAVQSELPALVLAGTADAVSGQREPQLPSAHRTVRTGPYTAPHIRYTQF